MVNVFDVWTLPEMPFLEELADELEGTFLMIIGAGYAHNLDFIRQRQKEIREEYGSKLEFCISDVAIFHISFAYDALQDILGSPHSRTQSPEEIIETASDALYEHLILAISEDDEEYKEYLGVFSD